MSSAAAEFQLLAWVLPGALCAQCFGKPGSSSTCRLHGVRLGYFCGQRGPMPGCCFHCQSKQEVEFENVQEQEPALQTSAGLASPKPITREPSPPPLPPPADPPPDSSPTLRQCLECRAVSQKKNNASHCVEILEDGFPHSDLVKCGIW